MSRNRSRNRSRSDSWADLSIWRSPDHGGGLDVLYVGILEVLLEHACSARPAHAGHAVRGHSAMHTTCDKAMAVRTCLHGASDGSCPRGSMQTPALRSLFNQMPTSRRRGRPTPSGCVSANFASIMSCRPRADKRAVLGGPRARATLVQRQFLLRAGACCPASQGLRTPPPHTPSAHDSGTALRLVTGRAWGLPGPRPPPPPPRSAPSSP